MNTRCGSRARGTGSRPRMGDAGGTPPCVSGNHPQADEPARVTAMWTEGARAAPVLLGSSTLKKFTFSTRLGTLKKSVFIYAKKRNFADDYSSGLFISSLGYDKSHTPPACLFILNIRATRRINKNRKVLERYAFFGGG